MLSNIPVFQFETLIDRVACSFDLLAVEMAR